MNTTSIEVVGTFQGYWTHWIRQVLAEAQHPEVHTGSSTWHRFEAFLRLRIGSNVLALVEHPATGLAHSLGRGDDVDPEAWLDDWMASARAILTYAQQNPDMILVVNAEEARHKPRRLAQLLQSSWGYLLQTPSRIVGHDHHPDSLALALAWGFVERDLALQDVVSEIMATCSILPGFHGAGPRSSGELPEGTAAARRLAEFVHLEQRLAMVEGHFESERSALRCELRSSNDKCAQLAATLQALEADRDRILARADAADRALADARRHMEAETRERNELEERLDAAESRQGALAYELTLAREEATTLGRRLDDERAVLAQAQAQRSRVERELAKTVELHSLMERDLVRFAEERSALEQALANAQAAARNAGQERTLVLQEMHQLKEDLQRTVNSKRETEKALHRAKEELAKAGTQRGATEQELSKVTKRLNSLEQELERATKHQTTLEQQLAQAAKQRSSLESTLNQVTHQKSKVEKELAGARENARAASEEADLLLQQLHQVQEELERTFLAKRDAENALVAAKAGSNTSKLEEDLRRAREESELLTLQTRQVQQELERMHAQKLRLVHDMRSRVALPWIDDVEIGEVSVVGERDTPPHREVSFVVRDVRAGERRVAEAAVRLVEHWGRPGIAIFAGGGQPPVLETWRETGQEDGRPYMLLVHGEDSAQRVYDAMGTVDWQLVQALAVRMVQALQEHVGHLSAEWLSLAHRLLTSLQEQPARLRYENVVVAPVEQKPKEEIRFSLVLERVSYQGRTWRRLPIQWQPYGREESLDLGRDEESGPPLLAWPADASGAPVPTLRLPLRDDPHAAEVRAVWNVLFGSDRAFVADLLTLMPILAMHMQAAVASIGDSTRQIDLQAKAIEAMQFGRAALQPPRDGLPQVERRRPFLKRMARRLRVTAKRPPAAVPAAEPALDQ